MGVDEKVDECAVFFLNGSGLTGRQNPSYVQMLNFLVHTKNQMTERMNGSLKRIDLRTEDRSVLEVWYSDGRRATARIGTAPKNCFASYNGLCLSVTGSGGGNEVLSKYLTRHPLTE